MVGVKRALAAVLLLILASRGWAAFNDIITGARPQGMGGAFVAVADDANALYWNPAGLTQLETAELTFMHANEYDITVGPSLLTDFVGFVNWPMEIGRLGLAVFQQGSGKVVQERSLLLSFAREIGPDASAGLNVKYLSLDPAGHQVTAGDPALVTQDTISFDAGGLLSVTSFWKLGFLVRNVGGELGAAVSEPLKRTYRIGSAYRFEDVMFMDDAITWSLDLFTKNDIKDSPGVRVQASTGVEYSFDERVSIRLGVDRGNLTAGLGFGHPEAGVFVDYAYSNDTSGTTHRISATYRFGAPPGDVHVVHHMPDGRRRRHRGSGSEDARQDGKKATPPATSEPAEGGRAGSRDGSPWLNMRPGSAGHGPGEPLRPDESGRTSPIRAPARRPVDTNTAPRTNDSTVGVSPIHKAGDGSFDREMNDFLSK